MKFPKFFGAVGFFIYSASALANEYPAPFTITSVYVSGAANFNVRLTGMANMQSCPAAPAWAYINGGSIC